MPFQLSSRRPACFSFLFDDEALHPKEVFERLYRGLDPLIAQNIDFSRRERAERRIPERRRSERAASRRRSLHDAACKNLADAWLYAEQEKISCIVEFEDGSQKTYFSSRRNNFERTGIYKRPNIVHFTRGTSDRFVLREARVYSLEELIVPVMVEDRLRLARAAYARDFDRAATAQFASGTGEALLPRQGKLMMVPEPHLLCALERMVADCPSLRVMPDIAALDASSDMLWYVREFLPKISDTQTSFRLLGRYFGKMHALGLMDILDRRIDQYAEVAIAQEGPDFEPVVGSFDLDFVLHTTHRGYFTHLDYPDIERLVHKDFGEGKLPLGTAEYYAGLKQASERTVDEMRALGVRRTSIVDYLRKEIDLAPFQRIEFSTP